MAAKNKDEKILLSFLQQIFGTTDDLTQDEIWEAFKATYFFGKDIGKKEGVTSEVEEETEKSIWDADTYLLGKNQTIDGNSKITDFGDGWKLHEWVDEPEKYYHKEKTEG